MSAAQEIYTVDASVSKVQRKLDTQSAKINKLAQENADLKSKLKEARASKSRVRKIPKQVPE